MMKEMTADEQEPKQIDSGLTLVKDVNPCFLIQ